VREAVRKPNGEATCPHRASALRIAATLAILASVGCLLGGCLRPEPSLENMPPEAHFTYGPASGNSPLAVSFDASSSEDADGVIESFEWDFGDDGTAGGVLASHTYTATATRTFVATLTITDDRGGVSTANASIVVTVSSPLPPPPSQQYVASANSDVFHRLNCSYVAQIELENRIYFDTREAAIGSGRRPCSRCNP
jgi:PKD repeat protein